MTLQQQKRATSTIVIALAVMFVVGNVQSSFAQIPSNPALSVTSDKNIYNQGEKIQLEIRKPPLLQQKVITNLKTEYAGISSPCGIAYFDFVFLEGDHTSISTYEQIVAVKDKALNVLYSQPYNAYLCPFGHVDKIEQVIDDVPKGKTISSAITSDSNKVNIDVSDVMKMEITHIYSKESLRKQIGPNEVLEYMDSKPIPTGQYTVIAFTMDGNISKPMLIEVSETKPVIQSTTQNSDNTFVVIAKTISPADWLISLLTIPALAGSVVFTVKKPRLNLKTKAWIIILILGLSIIPTYGQNNAFAAAYNVGSKGIEHRGTDTTFKTATVQDEFQGVVPSTNGLNNGFSVQNNHFVQNFAVGNDFLWAQSGVQIETPNSPTYNSHTCTTQSGSYTCKMPSQLNFRGVTNFWTDDFFGCPSGFVFVSAVGMCVDADTGTWKGWGLGSDITRVDVNAYQQIQSTGRIYMDQKVRFCTGSFSCGAYNNLFTAPTNSYANSNSYYSSDSIAGSTEYGTQVLAGECGGCNGNTGRITFNSGTYLTKVYTVQGPGNPVYRASGDDGWPSEDNDDICWWDSITDSGSTFTTTARHGTTCQS